MTDLANRPTSCRELLHDVDWAGTPLGAYAQWPIALKSYVAMVLEMPTPANQAKSPWSSAS